MATIHRLRSNLEPPSSVTGTPGAGLAQAATTITFSEAPTFATLGTDEYRVLRIGDELVHLTAYTAAATTGTISRGAEGTTDVAHSAGDVWEHVATVYDFAPVIQQFGWAATPSTHTNWSTYDAANQRLSSSGAQNDSISFDADFASDETTFYDLVLHHRKDTDRGIYTVRIGGKLAATDLGGDSDTIDGYAASAADARSVISGFTPASSGRLRVTLTMATKHASSSSYYGVLAAAGVSIIRTA